MSKGDGKRKNLKHKAFFFFIFINNDYLPNTHEILNCATTTYVPIILEKIKKKDIGNSIAS